jgi:hypothetical protein
MHDFPGEIKLEEFQGFDLLGFISGVHSWREPTVWRKFLQRQENAGDVVHASIYVPRMRSRRNPREVRSGTMNRITLDVFNMRNIGIRDPYLFFIADLEY